MTATLRARARELAEQAWDDGGNRAHSQMVAAIEFAILRGMAECLTAEETQEELNAAYNAPVPAVFIDSISGMSKHRIRAQFRAMAAERAKGLGNG